ncbi:MAG TPA: hypothetical protein VNN99_05660 [Vicinamibacterales bacterium]|nr:hypothetical protein [Vicinamibacterales bacterium]
MADITKGTGADSSEDILDEPALASVGVDPDGVVVAPDNTPGQDDEDDDEFDDDDDDAEDAEDEEDEKDEDGQSASNEEEKEG